MAAQLQATKSFVVPLAGHSCISCLSILPLAHPLHSSTPLGTPAGASLDAELPADAGWQEAAAELGLTAADCRLLRQLGETAKEDEYFWQPPQEGSGRRGPRTALCCAVLAAAPAAAAALVDAGAKLNGAFNELCQLSCPAEGLPPPAARVEAAVDALLRRGLDPPGHGIPAVQQVQHAFQPTSHSEWGRGLG